MRRLGNPILVYNRTTFTQMMQHLEDEPSLALDTESDSLFSYHTKVCLIQISVPTDPVDQSPKVTDYLVDPLRYAAIDEIGQLTANPDYEVILHAAENDIMLLQRAFRFEFANIYDTQLAGRILGWRQVGLAAILEENFGVVTDKRMQRTNWGKRPLTPKQIAYAQIDTHYLHTLRDHQVEQLKEVARWEEAQEAFGMLSRLDYLGRTPAQRSFWDLKEARTIPTDATGILEALWEWREQRAEQQDSPPFKILTNRVLAELAVARPRTMDALRAVNGLGQTKIKQYGHTLLEVIRTGQQRPIPAIPITEPRPEHLLSNQEKAHYNELRRWRSRVAKERGVTPDIVFSNDILIKIARHKARNVEELEQIPEIGRWKTGYYGPAICEILSK